LQPSAIALRIHGDGLDVFLEEIRPDQINDENTTQNGYLFNMERFHVKLRRIIIAPVPEILFVYVTGQVEVGFISHDQKEHPKPLHYYPQCLRSVYRNSHQVCPVPSVRGLREFVWMKPRVFMQNSLKGPACHL
jgi:hypothetical protein